MLNYTKQKKEEVYNLEEDSVQTSKPDIVINLTEENHIICDSKVSLDNWKKICKMLQMIKKKTNNSRSTL